MQRDRTSVPIPEDLTGNPITRQVWRSLEKCWNIQEHTHADDEPRHWNRFEIKALLIRTTPCLGRVRARQFDNALLQVTRWLIKRQSLQASARRVAQSKGFLIDDAAINTRRPLNGGLENLAIPGMVPTAASALTTSKRRKRDHPQTKEHARTNVQSKNTEKKEAKSETKTVLDDESFTVSVPPVRLGELGGIDKWHDQILELIVTPLRHPELYCHLGIRAPRGVLLFGPQGCGKTTLARAAAGEATVPLISVQVASLIGSLADESEERLRAAHNRAKTLAPSILFLDQIEALFSRHGGQREGERRAIAGIIKMLDEHDDSSPPIVIVAATNNLESIDKCLRRAGRFDREISVGIPGEEGRAAILECIARGLDGKKAQNLGLPIDWLRIAKLTPGFVAADLQSLATAAGNAALERFFEEQIDKCPCDRGAGSDSDSLQIVEEADWAPSMRPKSTSSCFDFLKTFPRQLGEQQLQGFCITEADYLAGVHRVQPTCKREGFGEAPNVTWNDIGALESVMEELQMAVVEPLRYPEVFRRIGLTKPPGILLWGPPGVGKTLLAKALASDTHSNFISVKGPELINKFVGESERAIRGVFNRARASAPCIIFFDEVDAICPCRESSKSEASTRVVNTMLVEMDGMDPTDQVFVVGATNRPDMIDPAILRPGRLGTKLYVGLPSARERAAILKKCLRGTPLHADVDCYRLARHEKSEGLSGADLAEVARRAAISRLRHARAQVGMSSIDMSALHVTGEDLAQALQEVNPSISQREREVFEEMARKYGSR